MTIQIVFETHSISEDNERALASGWHHSRLSDEGRQLAVELGRRRGHDGIQAVFTSDLRRAVETAEIAFGSAAIPTFQDWRLRECDYGDHNGRPRAEVHRDRRARLDTPYPGGESWRQAVRRVRRFLDDLSPRWEGARVLVIGHIATRWAFEHYLNNVPLEVLAVETFTWQPGWEYTSDRTSFSVRHLALVVPDLRAAERFYQKVFGMDLIGREAVLGDGLWYTLPLARQWEEADAAGIDLGMVALRKDRLVLALFGGDAPPGQIYAIGLTMPAASIADVRDRLPDGTRVSASSPNHLEFRDPYGIAWQISIPGSEFRTTGDWSGRWIQL